jgi:(S)-ureidoglycine aminohydrolase
MIAMFHVRQVLKSKYAIILPEDAALTAIPGWNGAEVKVLAAPCMGANFVEYIIDVKNNGKVAVPSQERLEYVFYVLNGDGRLETGGEEFRLEDGSYGFLPPKTAWNITCASNEEAMKFVLVKKCYEPIGTELPEFVIGLDRETPEEERPGEPVSKDFVPWREELLYDLSWFILYFDSGSGMTHAENHLHEHGLYMLSGTSHYLLDDTWYQTVPGDFIWMAPYVPQSCQWYGEERGAYLLYSNRNRDPPC